VTVIGNEAFLGCIALVQITLPVSTTTIGRDAFKECSSLASVFVPDAVTKIERGAFGGCSSLTSVSLPDPQTYTSTGQEGFPPNAIVARERLHAAVAEADEEAKNAVMERLDFWTSPNAASMTRERSAKRQRK
jgi:hypothetical protein